MPPRTASRQPATRRRWWWRGVLGLLVMAPVGAFPFLGRVLVAEDSLEPADAIIVLSGTRADRWLEAVDLHAEGYARTIVLSQGAPQSGEAYLESKGIRLPTPEDLAHDVMLQLGVSEDAIAFLPGRPDSTAEEAVLARRLATSSGWRRIIVVTSKQHTRRARLAFRRELHDTDVGLVVRASRYDTADPAQWWRTRSGLRNTIFEWIWLIVYSAGLGA